ncbi:MAG: energy-coupling factor transporter transmembrane component T [Rhodospirillaceae bacterium]
MIVGLFVPGESLIHRLSASRKLLALALLSASLVMLGGVGSLSAAAFLVGALFIWGAGLGGARLWCTTRPLLIWLLLIVAAQLWLGSIETAMKVSLRLIALVWAASLVTLTTKLSDMSDAIVGLVQPLERFGVSPQRVAFLIALTIRLIPAMLEIVKEVREAQRARGIERSVITSFVPVITRVLKQADELSAALTARGFERWDAPG